MFTYMDYAADRGAAVRGTSRAPSLRSMRRTAVVRGMDGLRPRFAIARRVGIAVAGLLAARRPVPPPKAPPRSPRHGARRRGRAAERPVPFRIGEVLVYDVSWSSYVTAGTATVTVREKKPSYGSTAYYIVAEGRPTPLLSKLYTLYYKADTLLDSYTLLPQRGSVYSEEGKDRRTKTTSFNQGARTAVYEVQTATNVRRDIKIPALLAGRLVGDLRAARDSR